MLADPPALDNDLLSWVAAKTTDGIFVVTPNDSLPYPWLKLILHLTTLQRRGLIRCSVHTGPRCVIRLTCKQPIADLRDGPSLNFEPSAQTKQKLKQYGFGPGQIADLLIPYCNTYLELSNDGFTRYCLNADKSIIESLTSLQQNWKPSLETIVGLDNLGLPSSIQIEYLQHYLFEFVSVVIEQASWDEHFLTWARGNWSCDNRNNSAAEGTFMCKGWLPSKNVIDQLVVEGIDTRWLDTLVMEYRIYWLEVGGKKVNWSNQFTWWTRLQWKKKVKAPGWQNPHAELLSISDRSNVG